VGTVGRGAGRWQGQMGRGRRRRSSKETVLEPKIPGSCTYINLELVGRSYRPCKSSLKSRYPRCLARVGARRVASITGEEKEAKYRVGARFLIARESPRMVDGGGGGDNRCGQLVEARAPRKGGVEVCRSSFRQISFES
jgi:hypothetical protein